ncbi:MAG: hypothetical protein GQ565_03710 [Candidatus Aegiribacteria sp.]|nr:hypothetical protein [Candidatus Aegiribacteria sp.]
MIKNEPGSGLTLFSGAAVILLILWIPVLHLSLRGVNEYFMLFCIWVGLVFTISMQSRRTVGYQVTLFPVFQGYMALTGYTVLQEVGFTLALFIGMFIHTVRIGETYRDCFIRSMKFMLICLLSLRITTLILQQFRTSVFESNYLTAAALSGSALLAVFLNQLLQSVIEFSETKGFKQTFRNNIKSAVYPVLFILFLLPAAVQTKLTSSSVWEWNLITVVTTVLVIQTGLSLLLDRARCSYSRTRFLENELGKHSEILTGLDSPIEALRILANFLYQAAETYAVRVTWKNISMTYPTSFETSGIAPISRQGEEGLLLEVWPSPRTRLDNERIEIFILQTETVLKNLELRISVVKSGWKCLEAMVYSLDMSDSRQAGYSRIVANIAREIGREMGMATDALDDLEMSAMLHLTAAILEKAEEDWHEAFSTSDPARTQFQLPPEVLLGIRHMTENYDGSGKPEKLIGKSIPAIARILSVASNFAANLSNQSVDDAILELKRRTGLIYDPDIVDILENISLQQENMVFSNNL